MSTTLNVIGIRLLLRANFILIAIQVVFLLVFFVLALRSVSTGEAPNLLAPLLEPGMKGSEIFGGAAILCLAFLGFDAVSTLSEEAKDPQHDLPIGILASLVICTILYGAVSLVITGMVKYAEIDNSAALATAFTKLGHPGYATLIAAGAVAGLTTVVLTLMIGASRVVFAMSRDPLLPARLS